MATKTLKTRIKLKHDSFNNWSNPSNQYRLLKGEIACATIDRADPANKKLPPVMFKVGDGEHTFNELTWASALAADVYDWAKAASKPSYTYEEVGADKSGAAATAESNAKAYTDQKIAAIPEAAEYTLEPGTADGSLVLKKDGAAVGNAAVVTGWAELLKKAQKGIDDAAAAKAAADAKYTLPDGGIPKAHLSTEVQTALDNADSAVQSVALASGTNNGTVKLTVDGTATDNIAVTGLLSAAFTESSAYATAEQGAKADKAIPNDGYKYVTGNIEYAAGYTTVLGRDPVENMEAATKQYVDAEVAKIDQFKYTISTNAATTPKGVIWYNGATKVTGTLVASADTEYNIYLVPCKHSAAQEQEGYDEYLTVKSGSTYSWEVLGNTRDIDLSQYVNTLSGTANSGVVTNVTKSGNTITVYSKSLATDSPTASGETTTSFIDTISQAADGQITATKKTIPNATTSAAGLMSSADKTKLNGIAENAQVNVIESITVGGVAQTPSSKVVALGEAAGKAVDTSIAANSTSTKLPTSKAVEDRINAHLGIDKVGTVTSVNAGVGLKVSGTASVTPKIEIDDSVVFVFNCGSATELVD
jgi:hypothetical protein|uniref:Hyaluronidase n=1 Tax=Siphoviridae sp. ctrgt10 TaxID=2826479 RepID=A0A8S5M7W1_9CAUD|nr:MAG TPA: hyaluronidase [Siphoviridae sp. ctrgt10]